MEIKEANPIHAPYIARAIMMALGEDICSNFASGGNSLEEVEKLFRICAMSDDSQYSWKNTLVATDDSGTVLGLVVSYDGARLNELRNRFLDEFALMHGYRIDQYMTEETTPDEYYIDSLAVFPEFRCRGVASQLIEAAAKRGKEQCGKHTGLLVEKTNHRARGLYDRMGFVKEGERNFAGETMNHMVLR